MIARFVSFCALKGIAPLIVSSTLLVSLSGCQTAAPVGEYAVIDGEKAAVPLIEMGDAEAGGIRIYDPNHMRMCESTASHPAPPPLKKG